MIRVGPGSARCRQGASQHTYAIDPEQSVVWPIRATAIATETVVQTASPKSLGKQSGNLGKPIACSASRAHGLIEHRGAHTSLDLGFGVDAVEPCQGPMGPVAS